MEQIVKQMFGEQQFQIAGLVAQVQALQAKIKELEAPKKKNAKDT